MDNWINGNGGWRTSGILRCLSRKTFPFRVFGFCGKSPHRFNTRITHLLLLLYRFGHQFVGCLIFICDFCAIFHRFFFRAVRVDATRVVVGDLWNFPSKDFNRFECLSMAQCDPQSRTCRWIRWENLIKAQYLFQTISISLKFKNFKIVFSVDIILLYFIENRMRWNRQKA